MIKTAVYTAQRLHLLKLVDRREFENDLNVEEGALIERRKNQDLNLNVNNNNVLSWGDCEGQL